MKFTRPTILFTLIVVLSLALPACDASLSEPTFTPVPSATETPKPFATSTITPKPSFTLRPTDTPNMAATQKVSEAKTATKAFFDERAATTQKYYELGYLSSTDGTYRQYVDFKKEWAQLGWYFWDISERQKVKDFYARAHFKWSSAFRNADKSGCGIVFAIQDNYDKYSVFLDRSGVLFYYYEESYGYYRPVGATREIKDITFENPFDAPAEADITLIVNNYYAYVLVYDELIGEYTLSANKFPRGGLGPAILSGTNKDFSTRCEITNFHAWIQNEN